MIHKFGIIGIALIILPVSLGAQERYPAFDKKYWINEQTLTEGKILRGVGLGITGLVSIWPTATMIARTTDNPQKYGALSAVFGLSTLSMILHGFGSVGFGKQQKEAAVSFIRDYDKNPDLVKVNKQQTEYLHGRKKTSRKIIVFGSYLTTVSAILLTNGIVQSMRKGQGANMNDIHLWPYYAAGGLLLPAGVGIMVRSKRKLNRLDSLETPPSVSTRTDIIPYCSLTENGRLIFGACIRSSF